MLTSSLQSSIGNLLAPMLIGAGLPSVGLTGLSDLVGSAMQGQSMIGSMISGPATVPDASGVPKDYLPFILEASQTYNIPPERLAAVIMAESGFNPNLRGRSGEYGLMQIMPGTLKEVGLTTANALDPRANILAGAQYLRRQYDMFGDWDLAHAAYNAGAGNVRKAGNRIPQNPYTPSYVQKINKFMPRYQSWGLLQ